MVRVPFGPGSAERIRRSEKDSVLSRQGRNSEDRGKETGREGMRLGYSDFEAERPNPGRVAYETLREDMGWEGKIRYGTRREEMIREVSRRYEKRRVDSGRDELIR